MNIVGETQAAPGYGDAYSPVFIVGQSLCGPCMATQIPFTGGSGRLIDQALAAAEVRKSDVFITNVVHCHPPSNRPSHEHEITNCRPFLRRELQIVAPKLIIGLGKDARAAIAVEVNEATDLLWPFKPQDALSVHSPGAPYVLAAPHPSWIMRQPQAVRTEFVTTLGAALRWAFA